MLSEKEESENNCQTSSTDSNSNDMASKWSKAEENNEGVEKNETRTHALLGKPKRMVRFCEESGMPTEVQIKVTVIELRGIFLDVGSNLEKSINDGEFCLDGIRACISVPSNTSNISTYFPSRPLRICSKSLDHAEAVASWDNDEDNAANNESCHLTFTFTQAVDSDGVNADDIAFMLNVISLPISLIHNGKMIPFGIAQLVLSNLSLIPNEAALTVRNSSMSEGGKSAILFKTKMKSCISSESDGGHSAEKSNCVAPKLLLLRSRRRSLVDSKEQLRMLRRWFGAVSSPSCKIKCPAGRACNLHIRIDVEKVLS